MADIVGTGDFKYRVIENWAKLPEGWSFKEVAAVATDAKDNVYAFGRGEHPIMVFDRGGNFLRSWGEGQYPRAHGAHMGPDDSIYLTDDGGHFVRKCSLHGKVMLKKASDNRRGPGSDRAWSLYLIREPRVHSNDKQRRRCERRLNLRSKCRAFAAREQRWQANRPADARGEACGFGAPLNHLIGGRLARRCAKTAPARSLPPKNGDQRLGRASLTRGNVAGNLRQ